MLLSRLARPLAAPARRLALLPTAPHRACTASADALGSLSITELKRMLADRNVDHRDCLEKKALVERLGEALRSGAHVVQSAHSAAHGLFEDERRVVSTFERVSESVAFVQTLRAKPAMFLGDVESVPQGQGSGFVWDEQGHVVTNYHVVAPPGQQTPPNVMVRLQSLQEALPATIVGTEPEKDLAVLRITAPVGVTPKLRPIAVGTSHDLLVGQSVMAIGNPFGFDYTLTTGVVSAVGRQIQGVGGRPILGCVQTDAAINPGNSGGPLLDSHGRLIGVNTMIISKSGTSSGIGFAIPVDTVRRVVNQLIRYGKTLRPLLGVQIAEDQTVRAIERQLGVHLRGALVMHVSPGTPAAKLGLRGTALAEGARIMLGDMITAVAGNPTHNAEELLSAVEELNIGSTVELTVVRGGVGHTEKMRVRLDQQR